MEKQRGRRKIEVTRRRSSVQFSRSVVSDSLQPHEPQHARPPCPSPAPGVYSNSCPSSQWCHPAISSSVVPFSSRPQSLPVLGSFPMSQLFAWGEEGKSKGERAIQLVINSLCALHSLEHSERFTELHREEKREEGDRGDQEEKRGSQKGRDKSSQ